MATTSPNRGYPVPQSSDDFRPYEDIAALATAVDTDMQDRVDIDMWHPYVRVVQGTAQTGWSDATYTDITFAAADVEDTDAVHDPSSNNARFLIGQRIGVWAVSGVYVPPSNSATTAIRCGVAKNGTQITGSVSGINVPSNAGILGVPSHVVLVRAALNTDYVTIQGWQSVSSGTTRGSAPSGTMASAASLWFLG